MRALPLLLPLLLAASPLRAEDAPDARDARLVSMDGEVTVYTAADPDGGAGQEGMPLEPGDRVATSGDSTAEIGFDDGSLIRLQPNTDLALTKTARNESELKLALGAVLLKIEKLLAGQSLSVRTPTAVAAVRGTEFGVEAAAEESHIGVFDEGRVEVRGDSGESATLEPNQETSAARGAAPLKPHELRRLVRHRALWKALRARAASMKARWKSLSPEKRQELRKKLLERMRERRQRLRERLRDRDKQRRERRRSNKPVRRKP